MAYYASNRLYSKGLEISFKLFHINENVTFPATLTSFSDSFTPNWNSETAFGRTEPIATYLNTQRTLSFGWQTVAGTPAEAAKITKDMNSLYSGLYPTYNNSYYSNAPIVGVKIGSFLDTSRGLDEHLTGYFTAIEAAPDFDGGWFINNQQMAPKVINFSISMQIIHSNQMDANGLGAHPYGVINAAGCRVSSAAAQPAPRTATTGNGTGDTPSGPVSTSNTTGGPDTAQQAAQTQAQQKTIANCDSSIVQTDVNEFKDTCVRVSELDKDRKKLTEATTISSGTIPLIIR